MKKFCKIFDVIIGVLLALFIVCYGTPAYLSYRYPVTYRGIVEKYAGESGLPASLIFSVIRAESGFRPESKSDKGAVGLMQILPETAEFVCGRHGMDYMDVYLTDPAFNIRVGCCYLAYLRQKFPVEETMLAAYNAGEGNVRRWLADETLSPDGERLTCYPFKETGAYVGKVKKLKNKYEKYYSFS